MALNLPFIPKIILFIRPLQCRHPLLQHSRIRADDRAVPSHLLMLIIDVCLRPLGARGILVAENEDVLILTEEPIDVFKFAARGFGVEEVDDGDEGGVEEGPDDVEFPM